MIEQLSGSESEPSPNLSSDLSGALLSRRHCLQLLAALGVGGMAAAAPAQAARQQAVTALQHKVNAYVQLQRRLGRVTRDEKTSWSAYDFNTGKKLVSINEDLPRQAASMIKPFVAQAYFYRHQESKSRYPFSAEVQRLMTAMIRDSNNKATNELIARVGKRPYAKRPKEVEQVLRHHANGVFQHVDIVEYIPKGGRSYRNKASARDYSRFLYAVWNGSLPYADDMKYLLGLPNRDRIQDGTSLVPDGFKILDKTGSTARLCGNMGIVVAHDRQGRQHPYTMIGIIEKSRRTKSYTRWIKDRGNVIREVSDLVYAEIKKQHGLV
jgi:beta-lactamase class A